MNKTLIFDSYESFLQRPEKQINGVSLEFSQKYPDFEFMNSTNLGCWNCDNCKECMYSISCSYCRYANGCYRCHDCSDCTELYDCNNMIDCFECQESSYCNNSFLLGWCSYLTNMDQCDGMHESDVAANDGFKLFGENPFEVPIIENIHTKVLDLAMDLKASNQLKDKKYENSRAEMVIHLGGEVAKKLEKNMGLYLAAAKIYSENSKIYVPWAIRFFEDEEMALQDIRRCAIEENSKNN